MFRIGCNLILCFLAGLGYTKNSRPGYYFRLEMLRCELAQLDDLLLCWGGNSGLTFLTNALSLAACLGSWQYFLSFFELRIALISV